MRVRSIVLSAVVVTGLYCGVVGAGDLNPPGGAVAPTMKTLEQIEPRTPIEALPFIIESSGSYYLTGNLTSVANGIFIITSDVMLDLMGFTITGPGPGSNTGIFIDNSIPSESENVTIRNGTVRSFRNGVTTNITAGLGYSVEDMRLVDIGARGVELFGLNNLIRDCYVQLSDTPGGGSLVGIQTTNAVIEGCRVGGGFNVGILAFSGSVVTDSVVVSCTTGISVSDSLVNGCTAHGNTTNLVLNGGSVGVNNYAP